MGAYGNTPEASKSWAPRPDLMVRLAGEAHYTGAGVYNSTGKDQTKSSTVPRGHQATYYLRARNNGVAADRFTIRGAAGVSGKWRVAYFDSTGVPVTGPVTGKGWTLASLAPGGAVDFRVAVTPLTGASSGGAFTVRVEARSQADPTVTDVVKGGTTLKAKTAPGAEIAGLAAIPTRGGAQVVFSLSSAAQVEARVLNLAGRPVRTLCLARPCGPGTNTLLWDARSDQGLRVPSGSYLAEVIANAPDGSSCRALQTLVMGQ